MTVSEARLTKSGLRTIAAAIVLGLPWMGAHAAIPAPEREALLDLYDSTQGQGWVNQAGWNGAAGTECSWFGVLCDAAQANVIEIRLPSNHLVGPLPATLDQLSQLQLLFLGNNQINGSIPPLDGFGEMRYLALSSNNLSGSIPSLSALRHLISLDLGNNELADAVPDVTNLPDLQSLDLSDNRLQGDIPPLDNLPKLLSLNLSDNTLTGTVPSLAGSPQLEYVFLAGNQLTGPPPELPRPDSLIAGGSALCANYLDHVASAEWDAATGRVPWYQNCPDWADVIFIDGFDRLP